MSRIANWALLGVVGLMAVVLVATVYATNQGIADASETLIRGQSSVYRGMIRRVSREPMTPEQLDELLAQHRQDGLRFIAVSDETGAIVGRAGAPSSDDSTRIAPGNRFVLEKRGSLIHMQVLPPPDRSGNAVVIEFEPRIASELRTGARRSLTIAAIAGAVLLLFAGLLIRWLVSQRRLEAKVRESERLASLGEMSATLAHEIRNPIASLKGNAQLLARMLPAGEKPQAKAERVVTEATRLEKLTNDLLEFARSGAIHREPTDPAALLSDVASRFPDADIKIDSSSAPPTWSLDSSRMAQVLANLIDNAIEANQESSLPVTASIGQHEGRLILEVCDHGSGIPAERREAIFTPFETDKTRGTGLGLAVAKRIATLHGGDIRATDSAGGGARFVVSIPQERP